MTHYRSIELPYQLSDLYQSLHGEDYDDLGIDIEVLRLDKIDTDISGNKWFKLRLNLELAMQGNQLPVISFGGAFSNHIHALAAAGNRFGFDTVGVIRGEAKYAQNPTLSDAKKNGMQLHFVDRKTYRQKEDTAFINALFERYGCGTVIPEGGANLLGVKGCEDIASLIELDATRTHHVVMAVATGTTFAGVLKGLSEQAHRNRVSNKLKNKNFVKPFILHGISVLKAGESIKQNVRYWLRQLDATESEFADQWVIHNDFTFGGYAQVKAPLVAMMDRLELAHSLPLDPVYTGKMLFGFEQLVKRGTIQPGDRVTLIHTGGLQGVRGCQARLEQLRLSMV